MMSRRQRPQPPSPASPRGFPLWLPVLCYLLLGLVWFLGLDHLSASSSLDSALTRLLGSGGFLCISGLAWGWCLVRHRTRHRQWQQELQHLGNHDPVTGQLNLNGWRVEALAALEVAAKGEQGGVLWIDLDRFRMITRALGHDTGERLLREIGARFAAVLTEADHLARVQGDEFVIWLAAAHRGHAAATARHLLDALQLEVPLREENLHLTASIGIALVSEEGREIEVLLRRADSAKNRAKQLGGGRFEFYSARLEENPLPQLRLEHRLRRAVEEQNLALRLQPLQSLTDGSLAGFEALSCWQGDDDYPLTAAEFIPLAEATGLIEPLGAWVFEQVCQHLGRWRDEGLPLLPVAVNLSPRQFQKPGLVEQLEKILRRNRLEARWLTLELTETVMLHDLSQALETLQQLRRLGLGLVVDDFGTGYSSLSYLQRLPVEALKIDQSFVAGLPDDGNSATLTRAMIAMAHGLELSVVAEGVENEGQRELLRQQGCDRIQGYIYHPPLEPERCREMLVGVRGG